MNLLNITQNASILRVAVLRDDATVELLPKSGICKDFRRFGTCRYGDGCIFAHETEDARNVNDGIPHKKGICRRFSITAKCWYGERCIFLHERSRNSWEIPITDSKYASLGSSSYRANFSANGQRDRRGALQFEPGRQTAPELQAQTKSRSFKLLKRKIAGIYADWID